MKLTRVTITGADDETNPDELRTLSIEFPFVEWGILVSGNSERAGRERYPSRDWCNALGIALSEVSDMVHISTHVCGRWARDILTGDFDWQKLPVLGQRIQINTHGACQVSTARMIDGMRSIMPREFIFQWDGVNDHLLYAARGYGIPALALFDHSGGTGLLPSRWPRAERFSCCGFAGGLGPDNVMDELMKIDSINGPLKGSFWIDMESGVRTGGKFDLQKVKKVLEEVSPLVNAE